MKEYPLLLHLKELRTRLIVIVLTITINWIIVYQFKDEIYAFLSKPLFLASKDTRIIFTSLVEAFVTHLKITFICSLIVSFPIVAWQIYRFLSPALYKQEKRAILPFFIVSPLLFLAGIGFCYFFIIPIAWEFFASFQVSATKSSIPLVLEAKFSEYAALVISFLLSFGLIFQLPVVLIILNKLGLVSINWLKKQRRYAIIVIFIVSAILTPGPDVLSQVLMAVPLIFLYELSILYIRLSGKKIHS
jgi:sec-independent protein translocase protein TatC